MSAKLARLRGLMRIRSLQEEMERRRLELAQAAVAEVETALLVDRRAAVNAREISRAALVSGDRGEWLLADAQGEVARANMDRLQLLKQKREAAVPVARAQWMESRREHEQAKVLVREAGQAHSAIELRREQSAGDEWVMSRWNRVNVKDR